MSARVAIALILLLSVGARQNDTLEQGVPQLIVEAQPEPRQTRLQEPEGLALGDIRKLSHCRNFSPGKPIYLSAERPFCYYR